MDVKEQVETAVAEALRKWSEAHATQVEAEAQAQVNTEPVVEESAEAVADEAPEVDSEIILDDETSEAEGEDTGGKPQGRLADLPAEEKAEAYKKLMRKHERRAHESYEKNEKLQSRLVEVERENALMKARLAYPELTDEDFASCSAQNAEGVQAWAKAQAEFLARHSVPVQGKEEGTNVGKPVVDKTAQALTRGSAPASTHVATTQDEAKAKARKQVEDMIASRQTNVMFR